MNADATSGIDVSAKTLDVSVLRADSDKRKRRKFSNDAPGHRQLVEWLQGFGVTRVVCEATGVYHLDVAFALTDASIPLMVANPRQVKRFIEARARNSHTRRPGTRPQKAAKRVFLCAKTDKKIVWSGRGKRPSKATYKCRACSAWLGAPPQGACSAWLGARAVKQAPGLLAWWGCVRPELVER